MSTRSKQIEIKRIVHMAEGRFSLRNSKMTTGALRYSIHDSVAVIDSTKVGKTAKDVIGFGGDVPVVANLDDAMQYKPEVMLIGITPTGGRLPADLKVVVLEAIEKGLDVWAGLHDFLANDPDVASAAERKGVKLWDLRCPEPNLPVGGGLCRFFPGYISLMVGSDAAIGKMTAALEIDIAMKKAGIKSEFVATGQCGIAIAGWGSPIDAIAGDFMAGCVERDVLSCEGAEVVLVEGQGSMLHPGFSSVTLGLMHGACPDGLILCHKTGSTEIEKIQDVKIPPFKDLMELYLGPIRPFKPDAKVIGISLNTSQVSEEEAKAAVKQAEAETGLPVSDPIRFGSGPLIEAIQKHRKEIGK